MKTALCRAVVIAAALALLTGVASAATTSLTFTSPKPGSSVSRTSNPYLAVAGNVSFASTTATTKKFYLRRDGCGTSNDNPHLSVIAGTDGGDGCGLIISSVVGVGGTVDNGAFVDFPSTDGMPLAFDSGRKVTGTIDLESFGLTGNDGLGAGLLQVDVSLEALDHGNGVNIGSDTESVLITPTAANYPVAFTIQPNTALAGHDLSGLDVRVHVHGPFTFSGFIGNSGKSWTTVPSFAASINKSVAISVDSKSFANAIPARLSGSTWTLAIPTPAVGTHTIYAKSTQGFTSSAVVSDSFTVTK